MTLADPSIPLAPVTSEDIQQTYREFRGTVDALDALRLELVEMVEVFAQDGRPPDPTWSVAVFMADNFGFMSDCECTHRVREMACRFRAETAGVEPMRMAELTGPSAIDISLSVAGIPRDMWKRFYRDECAQDPVGAAISMRDLVLGLPDPDVLRSALELERCALLARVETETDAGRPTVHIVADQVHVADRGARATETPVTRMFKTECREEAKKRADTAWVIAKKRGEQYVKLRGFPGLNELAFQCYCSKPTMQRAIEASTALLNAKAERLARRAPDKGTPRAAPTDVVMPTESSVERDNAIRRLIEACTPEQRQMFHDPEHKVALENMSLDMIETMIAACESTRSGGDQ